MRYLIVGVLLLLVGCSTGTVDPFQVTMEPRTTPRIGQAPTPICIDCIVNKLK